MADLELAADLVSLKFLTCYAGTVITMLQNIASIKMENFSENCEGLHMLVPSLCSDHPNRGVKSNPNSNSKNSYHSTRYWYGRRAGDVLS